MDRWRVSINNGQRIYVLEAPSAGESAMIAGAHWRADITVTPNQRAKGIYDIRIRRADYENRPVVALMEELWASDLNRN